MSKRDLFVIIYCCTFGSCALILLMLNNFVFNWVDSSTFALLTNFLFMLITASFVFIKPVGKFVDNYIINKLP